MPIDSARLEELQIVRKIRETVRRWWGIELSFTDAKGFVLDHRKGIIIPDEVRHRPDAPTPNTLVIASKLATQNLHQRLKEFLDEGQSGSLEERFLELVGAGHFAPQKLSWLEGVA